MAGLIDGRDAISHALFEFAVELEHLFAQSAPFGGGREHGGAGRAQLGADNFQFFFDDSAFGGLGIGHDRAPWGLIGVVSHPVGIAPQQFETALQSGPLAGELGSAHHHLGRVRVVGTQVLQISPGPPELQFKLRQSAENGGGRRRG